MDLIERAAKEIARRTPDGAAETRDPRPSADAGSQSGESASQRERPIPERLAPRLDQVAALGDGAPPGESRTVAIDIDQIERAGYLSPRHPVTRIAEEYRVIKRRVLTRIADAKGEQAAVARLIMVTSSQPKEGKTFTAINLALSIAAERDKHVLLIDGDFAYPGLFRTLGLKRRKGFLDVLRDPNLDFGDVILRTNIEHLSIVDAGRASAIATEFLSSEKMQRLVAEIASRYDDRIIIFDSPPMLATSEPSILSHHVGQILLVVEAGRTSQRGLKAALNLIHDKEKVQLVLNKTESLLGAQSFGSYYYDYYNKAKSMPEKPAPERKPRKPLFSR